MTEEARLENVVDGVRPKDCVLAVAIPLSFGELEEDLLCTHKEFSRKYILPSFRAATARTAWDGGYQQLVDKLRQIFSDVRGFGGHVVEGVRLADLGQLFARYRCVSLLAHGPFPSLSSSDVLEPQALLSALHLAIEKPELPCRPVVRWLASSYDLKAAHSLADVVKTLRLRINRTKEYYANVRPSNTSVNIFAALEAMQPEGGLTRMLLHEGFPGILAAPPIVELRDGIHNFEAFCAEVPDSFRGTLDFTVCSALWFAEPLRRRRPNCGDILSPKQPADLLTRCILYKAIVHQLHSRSTNFTRAALAVHDRLIRAYSQESLS